jgi:hypothetical protein
VCTLQIEDSALIKRRYRRSSAVSSFVIRASSFAADSRLKT